MQLHTHTNFYIIILKSANVYNNIKQIIMNMDADLKMITTEIHLPSDILYSQGIGKDRVEYFVKKNFLLELYREGKISLGKMAELLDMNLVEMLGILKDSNVPLNYGVEELEEDIKTAKRLGLFYEDSQ
jgi:predicted HTH domain antitoxin